MTIWKRINWLLLCLALACGGVAQAANFTLPQAMDFPFLSDLVTDRAGNRMAIANIRERLALFFDAEARMEATVAQGRYRVEIEMPYRTDTRTDARAA